MTSAPPPRGQLVGSALRQYREAAGYSLAGAARLLGCGPLKISRIEVGERGVYERELRSLLTGYGVDAAVQDVLAAAVRPRRTRGWQARYNGLLADSHLAFLAAESAARSICAYAPVQLPALLHSTAYARAAAAADPGTSPDEVETIVQATYARQQAVLREQDTFVTVIIGEAALRQHAGNAAMMCAQYRRLPDRLHPPAPRRPAPEGLHPPDPPAGRQPAESPAAVMSPGQPPQQPFQPRGGVTVAPGRAGSRAES